MYQQRVSARWRGPVGTWRLKSRGQARIRGRSRLVDGHYARDHESGVVEERVELARSGGVDAAAAATQETSTLPRASTLDVVMRQVKLFLMQVWLGWNRKFSASRAASSSNRSRTRRARVVAMDEAGSLRKPWSSDFLAVDSRDHKPSVAAATRVDIAGRSHLSRRTPVWHSGSHASRTNRYGIPLCRVDSALSGLAEVAD